MEEGAVASWSEVVNSTLAMAVRWDAYLVIPTTDREVFSARRLFRLKTAF